jgi:hypothetical protein
MNRISTLLLSAAFATVLFAAPTFAGGTYDGQTPAEELVCDHADLEPGAYGLCIAYCEAQDCDVRPNRRDCKIIRENFEKRTGSAVLPCDLGSGSGGVQ